MQRLFDHRMTVAAGSSAFALTDKIYPTYIVVIFLASIGGSGTPDVVSVSHHPIIPSNYLHR